MVKSKKNKKDSEASAAVDASDSGEENERVSTKKKSVFQMFVLDDEDGREDDDEQEDREEEESVKVSKKSKKQKQKNKKAQKEPEDDDDEFDFSEKEKEKPKGKKEKKGKNRKRNNEDEEEIEKMLAELELEYDGSATKKPTAVPTENRVQETKEEDQKKKKKPKEREEDEDEQVEDNKVEEEEDLRDERKKKKKKKGKEVQVEVTTTKDDQTKEEEKVSVEEAAAADEKPNVEKEEEKPTKEKEDEEDADDKKKSGKKEKEDKKRPGKRQLLAMQEALRKLKEDEERLRLEEEAKIKAAEEAQRLREEQLRIAKEKKERQKQREKEKKERLKAEGKLLTKAQMAQRARAIATIEAFRAQGIDIPSIGEKRDRPVRPVQRSRVSKGKTNKDTDVLEHAKNRQESVAKPLNGVNAEQQSGDKHVDKSNDGIELEVQPEAKPAEVEENAEEPKDTWDLSSDSEKEDEGENKQTEDVITKKVQISIKEDVSKERKSSAMKSSSESESSEEEEEEEEEESESEGSDDDDESESDDNQKPVAERLRDRALARIQKRREENENKRSQSSLRSPIVCVLGHVDTGKTKILDKIRHTHVQDSEAGGITQQIGATMVPVDAIKEQAKMVKNFSSIEFKYPGLLIIDTPGHESFSNLRSRGSSLCDIAILVVDIMHGLEPQTIESINLLKKKKTPFVVALNKVDRIYDWKVTRNKDIRDSVKSQSRNTVMEFEERANQVIVQFAEQGLNAALFYENKEMRTFVSLIPTSATTGEGMGNLLALVVELTQNMLAKRLAFSEELQATVLELKAIPGLGTTIDVILVNGRLKEGDTIVLAGMEGPVVTQIRSLLMPQPLKELRVKNPYQEYKEVKAAQGVKLTAKDLEKVIAGLNLTVAHHPDEIDILKEDVSREFHAAMNSIKLAERGVYVQASTLGSLEALLEFLRTSKVPYSGIRIGPVVKRDVMKASIMLEHDSQYAVILAFDVKIERDAQELADSVGVKIFSADIIYHLFDRFTEYREQLKAKKREEFKHIAVFPCKLRILPNCIFNSRDPIVVGVSVEAGVVREGTPLCVPSQEFLDIGIVTTIEINHKQIDTARKGQEVCIKIEPIPGESPKLFGRHFDLTDMLVSKVTRQSIDACKEYFRDDLQKSDWQLMVELKKLFEIL